MNGNEFDDSRYIQNDKLNETKFPQILFFSKNINLWMITKIYKILFYYI